MTNVVMYHYIRKFNKETKNLNFLHHNSFIKQLNFFKKKYSFYNLDDNFKNINSDNNKILLTFDDGLKEHLLIAKILKKKNIKGIFFISSKPLISKDFLTVHKIHLILAKFNEKQLEQLFIKFNLEEFFKRKLFGVFKIQKNLLKKIKDLKKREEIFFKVQLNIISQRKPKIIDNLFDYCFTKKKQQEIFNRFYLNKKDIIQIKKLGMEIGSHGHSHKVLSLLKKKDQLFDIKKSISYLKKLTGKPITFFCYPYGGKSVYNNHTINILKKLRIIYAFSVESRLVQQRDSLFEIPRFDCNDFPYGKAFKKNELI